MENLQMGVPFFWVVAAFFVGRGYHKNGWMGALIAFADFIMWVFLFLLFSGLLAGIYLLVN